MRVGVARTPSARAAGLGVRPDGHDRDPALVLRRDLLEDGFEAPARWAGLAPDVEITGPDASTTWVRYSSRERSGTGRTVSPPIGWTAIPSLPPCCAGRDGVFGECVHACSSAPSRSAAAPATRLRSTRLDCRPGGRRTVSIEVPADDGRPSIIAGAPPSSRAWAASSDAEPLTGPVTSHAAPAPVPEVSCPGPPTMKSAAPSMSTSPAAPTE